MYPPPRPGYAPYAPMGGPPYGGPPPPYGSYPAGGPPPMYPAYPAGPGMGPGGVRPPLRSRPPGVPPPKSTTLWVGKIAPTVEESVMRSLLEACGLVRDWKPVIDNDTGRLKGFGFCTYEKPEGALLALRVLNNLNVDGQELALKCNTATEEYIEWFKSHQEALKARAGEGGAEEAVEIDENAVLERVMSIVSARGPVAPKADAATAAAANEFLASLKDDAGGKDGRRQHDRKREREQEEYERERQRQKREEQRRQEQEERAYRDALREWEEHERVKQREAEKERDRAADLLKERARQVHADNEGADTDDDEEPWARRFYKSSRRAADRRRRREAELAEDSAIQAAEEAEAAAALAAEEEKKAAPMELEADYDDGDAIYQAMMKAAVSAKTGDQLRPAEGAPVRRKVVKGAFGDDEEEDKPQRKLIPIQYTEEEQQAWQRPDTGEDGVGEDGQAAAAPSAGKVDPAALKKELMAMIPKDQQGVFAFSIKWESLDKAPPDVKDRVAGWVSKKIKDLMGEEEKSFCEFIMTQVTGHVQAQDMLEALRDVLDEDADSFVTKLFQVLIYETEKLARLG